MSVLMVRPLDRWPRAQTTSRVDSPFQSRDSITGRISEVPYHRTLTLLERELDALHAREAVLQLAITDDDLRIDGSLRANAHPTHPGVVLTFTASDKGVLTFACDRFTRWQANLRAIALGLEALRKVERYGITSSGEQYVGWKELPSGIPLSQQAEPETLSLEEAARVVVGWISGPHDLAQNARTAIEDGDYRRYAYRQALKHLHPDAGGDDSDAFLRLQRAIKALDENDA